LEKGLAAQVAALVVVIGFLCFAGGYVVAGGIQKQAGQYLIGENIMVNVMKPGETVYTQVKANSGMTVLDVVANIMPIKTEIYAIGPGVKTADNQWLLYSVNGQPGTIGMDKYQLIGGENIELTVY
jgi:hypothetical protein